MMDILEALSANRGSLFAGRGAETQKICEAERNIRTVFAQDYRQVLRKYGIIAYDGHELTGITDNPNLSVVHSTLRQRQLDPRIPSSWYVIEETGMDGIIVWQSPGGTIYESIPGAEPEQIASNLGAFLGL